MIEPKPGILGTSRAYRETVADERTDTEYDDWDSQVMQAMRDIGAKEGSAASGLMRVAVDVCDSLLVASVIHSRFPQVADRKISFADIFEQVSIGVRESSKRVAELEQKRRENSEGVYLDGEDFERHEMR